MDAFELIGRRMNKKICEGCGKQFEQTKETKWKWLRKKFCGKECRNNFNRITVYEIGRWRRQ